MGLATSQVNVGRGGPLDTRVCHHCGLADISNDANQAYGFDLQAERDVDGRESSGQAILPEAVGLNNWRVLASPYVRASIGRIREARRGARDEAARRVQSVR